MDEFKKIRDLAALPAKDEKEMGMVEVIMFLYNEHAWAADNVIPRLVKHANYPFRLTFIDNTRQISPINFSRVWNKYIQESRCEFIAFLDSDVLVHQDWLKRLMESFQDPKIDVAVPVLDNTSCSSCRATSEAPYPSFAHLREILAAQMVVYRRSVFDRVGYFDERFLVYGQDSEWGYRFLKKGGKGIIRKDVFVNHVGSYSLNKFAEERKETYNKSIEREYARRLFDYLKK